MPRGRKMFSVQIRVAKYRGAGWWGIQRVWIAQQRLTFFFQRRLFFFITMYLDKLTVERLYVGYFKVFSIYIHIKWSAVKESSFHID